MTPIIRRENRLRISSFAIMATIGISTLMSVATAQSAALTRVLITSPNYENEIVLVAKRVLSERELKSAVRKLKSETKKLENDTRKLKELGKKLKAEMRKLKR